MFWLIVIVTVLLSGPIAKAEALAVWSPADAAKIKGPLRQNAGDAEIVVFADNRAHPVTIVRGLPPALHLPNALGFDEVITFGAGPKTSVRILRGRPAVKPAALSVAVLRGVIPAPPRDRDQAPLTSNVCLDLAACGAALDRIAWAVDGAESSHGADPEMWRADPNGPQGPMQVSAAAAVDAGGGDRFDLIQNRQLGRAYLAQLFRRYGDWPDAVAAYNWGPGNLNLWIAQGRPATSLPPAVERYRARVLRDGGIGR